MWSTSSENHDALYLNDRTKCFSSSNGVVENFKCMLRVILNIEIIIQCEIYYVEIKENNVYPS